ncbi:MAG TPA: alkaline phosphatase family protein [Candidatus Angelobacter sp.]|nr:alkaline phosphatase family protein [Candidatus Angelobacter sp.]
MIPIAKLMQRAGGFLLPFALFTLIGCGGSSSHSTNPSAGGGPVPAADHVFLVVLENHSFSQVIGSPAMPYLNSLATQHALAANYFANLHPSIPNYFMLTVGLPETIDDNFAGTVTDDNVVRALTGAGKTWKAYIESLPSQGFTGGDVPPLYLKHHNPFAYLSDVLNSSAQTSNIVPFSQLATDLASSSLPNFAFIVPNTQDDAHDCPGGAVTCADSAMLAAADAWLKSNIDPLITSSAFGNSVLIITWDESTLSDITNVGGQVATVLVGPRVKTGFRSTTFYQHQSTLRLVLDSLRVSDLPNTAATAPSMSEFFQ